MLLLYLLSVDKISTAKSMSAGNIGSSADEVTFASELAMLPASTIVSVSFNPLRELVRFVTYRIVISDFGSFERSVITLSRNIPVCCLKQLTISSHSSSIMHLLLTVPVMKYIPIADW